MFCTYPSQHRYQRSYATPCGLFASRALQYFVQFPSRMSTRTGLPEVICYKIGGEKDNVRKQYNPQEKHPVNIDLAMGGPNSLTLHKLCKTFWLHRRSGGQNREKLTIKT